MRVLVTGDRDWDNKDVIWNALWIVRDEERQRGSSVTVVHGNARGADKLAERAAEDLGLEIEGYPADWEQYGKAAGPIRNREMLNSGVDLVLAFHSDLASSKGTKDMVFIANKEGVPVRLYADTRR